MSESKCKDLVTERMNDRISDIEKLIDANGEEVEGIGNMYDYGLDFSWVQPGTFPKQRAGYWRWQISWGGPSEEFLIYENGDVDFWYKDWFDGACESVPEAYAEMIKGWWGPWMTEEMKEQ